MGGVRVRPATAGDLDALEALERHFPGDRMSRAQLRRFLTQAHATVWVAETPAEGGAARAEAPAPGAGRGSVVGDAVLAYRRGSTVARLYSIVVDPAARGRGVGAALLAAAEEDAARHGARVLALEVREDNAVARALYERRGYDEVGRVPGYYHDGCTGVRMRKPLPPVEDGAGAAASE